MHKLDKRLPKPLYEELQRYEKLIEGAARRRPAQARRLAEERASQEDSRRHPYAGSYEYLAARERMKKAEPTPADYQAYIEHRQKSIRRKAARGIAHKLVQTAYLTTDGKLFHSRRAATHHQVQLLEDGLRLSVYPDTAPDTPEVPDIEALTGGEV